MICCCFRDPDAEEGSVKMDCQGAVGFEIEGDIDEDAEFDIANVNRSHMSGGSNSKTTLKEVDELKPAATIESRDGSRNGENNEIKEEKEGKEKSHKLQKADRVVNDVVEEGENEAEIETTDAQRPDAEKEGAEKEGTEKEGAEKEGAEKGVQEVDSEANDSPIEEIEIGEDSKEEEYDFEDVSIGVGGQKIVLVAHHEGDNGFEVAFGNDINDLEFQEDEDNEDAPGDNSDDHQKSSGDVLRADDGYDRDLSPRVESVTGLLESNTAHANQSVSINMSVASLRSDSDDEEAAVPSRKERISKLDSKVIFHELTPLSPAYYVNHLLHSKLCHILIPFLLVFFATCRAEELADSQRSSPAATASAYVLTVSPWNPPVLAKSGSCSLGNACVQLLLQAGATERTLHHGPLQWPGNYTTER